jgi:hypothetical protein
MALTGEGCVQLRESLPLWKISGALKGNRTLFADKMTVEDGRSTVLPSMPKNFPKLRRHFSQGEI